MAGESAAAVLSKKNGPITVKETAALSHTAWPIARIIYCLLFFPTIVSETGSQPVHIGKHCVKKTNNNLAFHQRPLG